MDNFDNSDSASTGSSEVEDVQQEEELSHSDKLVGIFTEPGKTFENIAQHPYKTVDWFLPFFLLLLITAICHFILMNNPAIKYSVNEKAISKVEKRLDAEVKAGHITQDQANQQISRMRQFMGGSLQTIIAIAGIFIGGFIVFFILAGIYFLLVKFILKGDGNYMSILIPYGLTSYIAILGIVIATILAFVMNRYFLDISLASILNSDKTTFIGFILDKLNIITIWVMVVLGIGFSKTFKSKSSGKYIILVLCLWFFGSLIFYFLGHAFPFLQFGA